MYFDFSILQQEEEEELLQGEERGICLCVCRCPHLSVPIDVHVILVLSRCFAKTLAAEDLAHQCATREQQKQQELTSSHLRATSLAFFEGKLLVVYTYILLDKMCECLFKVCFVLCSLASMHWSWNNFFCKPEKLPRYEFTIQPSNSFSPFCTKCRPSRQSQVTTFLVGS